MVSQVKVGILGGGPESAQFIKCAIDYGISVSVMDKDANAPAARYTKSFTRGNPASYDDVIAFGVAMNVITIENENVNTAALKALEKKGVKIYPSTTVIELTQNKFILRKFLTSKDIPVVPGIPVIDRQDLYNHAEKLPAYLRRCNSKGENDLLHLETLNDLLNAFDEPCILEMQHDIKQELSVIVCRNTEGAIECYEPVSMVYDKEHKRTDFMVSPAHISSDKTAEACRIAISIAEAFELVGVLTVQMILTEDDRLLVNDIAPRMHPGGYHTLKACTTSQYEQQLRAILELPLGETTRARNAVTIDIVAPTAMRKAGMEQALKTLLCVSDTHMHLYGTRANKPGEEIGRIIIVEDSREYALSKTVMVKQILKSAQDENKVKHQRLVPSNAYINLNDAELTRANFKKRG